MPTRRTAIASALAMIAATAFSAVPSPLFVAIRRARLADAAHRQAGRDTLDVFGLHGPRPAYWRTYRFAGKLRRGRDADPVNSVSPELVRLIAECLSATASLYAISDSALGSQTANDAIRRASEARTAVALFQAASGADTWAKARCLAAIYNREVMREEIEAEAGSGVSLDGFALALAAEVIDLTASADASALLVSSIDPILAAIAEADRLRQHVDEVYHLPDIGIHPLPEKEEASGAFHDHIMDVLLETVPTTAAGCVALVRFAQRYQDDIGTSMCEGNLALVALIARSPAL